MKTIIKYNRRRLQGDLFLGIAWTLFFGVGLVVNYENIEWHYYLYILLSFIYLGKYFYESHYHYLIIDNESIIKPNIFDTQKINISDITHVKKFAGDITIYTDNTKIGISKNLVEQESYNQLESF